MTSPLPDLTHNNISLQVIPLAWLISLAPRMWGRHLYHRATNKDMDVVNPRNFKEDAASESTIDSRTQGRILRAEAAMNNGYENIGMFAAAVVAGNAAGLSPKLLNGLSLGYVTSRVAYNVIYIYNETFWQAAARSVTFFSGLGMCFALFIKAGEKFKRAIA